MKIKTFLAIILAMFVFASFTSFIYPQQGFDKEVVGGAVKLDFGAAEVDSVTTTTYSKWFTLPIIFKESTIAIYWTKIMSSAGTPRVTTILQGSDDKINIAALDTIGTNIDSLKTLYTGTADLNAARRWFYRIQYKGEASNPSDVTNKVIIKYAE